MLASVFTPIVLGTILASKCNAAYVQFQSCNHVNTTNETAMGIAHMDPESLRAYVRPKGHGADLNFTFIGRYFDVENCDDSALQSILADVLVTNIRGAKIYQGQITSASCANRAANLPRVQFEIASTIDQLSSLDTIHTRVELHMPNGTSFGCGKTTITPQIGRWAQVSGFLIPFVVLCMAIAVAFWSFCKNGYRDDRGALGTQTQNRYHITRIADLLAYIQFIFFSGALNLQYPGFLQPVIGLCGWSMLMLPSGPVITDSIYSGVKDGIYETNGTITGAPGLELITQITASPPKGESWINTLSLSLFLFFSLCLLVLISDYAFSRRHRGLLDNDQPSAQDLLKRMKGCLWNATRLFLSYFLLPLTMWSMYLLTGAIIHPSTSMLATFVLVLLTLGLWWFVAQHGARDIGYFIVPGSKDANLQASELHMKNWPAWVMLSLMVIRGFAIGSLQSQNGAQFAILLACEVFQFACSFYWIALFSFSSFPTIISALRLVSFSLHAGFLPEVTSHALKMALGYAILSIHLITLGILFLIPVIWELVKLTPRMSVNQETDTEEKGSCRDDSSLESQELRYSRKSPSIASSNELIQSQHQKLARIISGLEHNILTKSHSQGMTIGQLMSFVMEVQGENPQTEPTIWSPLLAKLAANVTGNDDNENEDSEEPSSISVSTLVHVLLSPNNMGIVQEPQEYDLDSPINEYFISSSHNTYLLGRQVVARSTLQGYIAALMDGCRCIEIDCWDGRHGRPIVKHGYALTASVSFQEVINAINKYAFCQTEFPLWISLEVHCSGPQQQIMADIMKQTFGQSLVTEQLEKTSNQLPSPSQLRRRILIKARICQESLTTTPQPSVEECTSSTPSATTLKTCTSQTEEDNSHLTTILKSPTTKTSTSRYSSNSNQTTKSQTVQGSSKALEQLAVYGPGKKFKTADRDDPKRQYIYSLSESNFKQQTKFQADTDFLSSLNKRHITRVYPDPTRIDSSNFNPLQCWKHGVQMVAMNYQTGDGHMSLHKAMFSHGTDASGYVRKPDLLRQASEPVWAEDRSVDFSVTVMMTTGVRWPRGSTNDTNTYSSVELEILVPDERLLQDTNSTDDMTRGWLKVGTRPTLDESQDKIIDEKLTFSIKTRFPSLVFVRWSVTKWSNSRRTRRSEASLSQVAKLENLKTGYRLLPLMSHFTDAEVCGYLFCKLERSIQ